MLRIILFLTIKSTWWKLVMSGIGKNLSRPSKTEEAMSTTAQAPLIVQGLAPFEVEVAAPRPPFTVYRASSPIQCYTHVVPWDYNQREMNVEETDIATGVTRS